jgi:hypothetical protein
VVLPRTSCSRLKTHFADVALQRITAHFVILDRAEFPVVKSLRDLAGYVRTSANRSVAYGPEGGMWLMASTRCLSRRNARNVFKPKGPILTNLCLTLSSSSFNGSGSVPEEHMKYLVNLE